MKGFFNYDELKKFIGLVEQHPVLYDPAAKTGSSRSPADVWVKITTEMNVPSMDVPDWKSKWKCLRDTFVKKKKDTRLSGSQMAVDKATQWRFFEPMAFLDQFVDKTRIKAVPRSNGSDYQHYTIVKKEEYAEGDSVEEEAAAAAGGSGGGGANVSYGKHPASESSHPSTIPAKVRRRDAEDDDDMNDDDDEEDDEDEDGDEDSQWNVESGNSRSFFMSCAYRMDRLPERVQSYLQLQVSQLFFNAENPEVHPVPIMPLPPRSSTSTSSVQLSKPS